MSKQSFLSNLVDYDGLKHYARIIVIIGSCVIALVFGLSLIYHSQFISNLLGYFFGASLLFIIYIAALIIVLDFKVEIDEDKTQGRYHADNKPKPFKYKLTVVWGVLLLLLGIAAVFFSNRYRKNYAFDCSTFLVDEEAGVYHLDNDWKCIDAIEAEDNGQLVRKYGYEIDKTFKFCEYCEESIEEVEGEFNSNRYTRR